MLSDLASVRLRQRPSFLDRQCLSATRERLQVRPEDLEELLARPRSPLASISERARANLGTPRSQITTSIDVTRWARQKQDAFRAHHSQTGEGGPLSGAAPATLERRLISEHFVRAALPWQADGVDIVAQVASDVATRQA